MNHARANLPDPDRHLEDRHSSPCPSTSLPWSLMATSCTKNRVNAFILACKEACQKPISYGCNQEPADHGPAEIRNGQNEPNLHYFFTIGAEPSAPNRRRQKTETDRTNPMNGSYVQNTRRQPLEIERTKPFFWSDIQLNQGQQSRNEQTNPIFCSNVQIGMGMQERMPIAGFVAIRRSPPNVAVSNSTLDSWNAPYCPGRERPREDGRL